MSFLSKIKVPAALTKKRLTIGAVALGVVVVVVAGFMIFDGGSSAQTGQTVIYAQVQTRTLKDTVPLTGTLSHKDITTVSAQSPGFVSAVYSQDNTVENVGQTMFSLNGRNAIAEQGIIPFFRSLAPGDQGDDVLQLKQILAAAGDNPGPIDSSFTQQTQAALAQWQAQNHYPSATPANPQAVSVSLQQGVGYTLGNQDSSGLIIGPPAGYTNPSTLGPGVQGNTGTLSSYRTPVHPHAAPTVSITALNPVVSSGSLASFSVTASAAVGADTTVNLSASGSAVGSLTSAVPTSVLLPNGSQTATFSVAMTSVGPLAGGSTITFTVGAGVGYTVGTPSAATSSIASTNIPTLTIVPNTSVGPGNTVTLTITATQSSSQDLQIPLSLSGNAVAGTNYVPVNPIAVLPAFSTTTQFSVTTLISPTLEPNLFLNVSISPSASGAYLVGNPGTAMVTILGVSGPAALPVVTLTSPTTYLQKGKPYQVSVNLSQAVTTAVTISLSYGGTAVQGTDYSVPGGTIVVPPGQSQITVTIPTVSDNTVEPDRVLVVGLQASSQYQVGTPSSVSVTITNSNVPGISISGNATINAGDTSTFTVTADKAPDKDLSVTLSFAGDAQPGSDYVPPNPVLIIKAGTTTATEPIQTLINQTLEPTRYIVVSVTQSASGSYTVASPGAAVVTISGVTSSSAPPIATLTSATTYLQKGKPYQVTVSLNEGLPVPLTINLGYSGTAVNGVDFTPAGGNVTVPAGQTAVQVTIPTVSDNVVESDRTLVVSLLPSITYQIGVPNAAAVTITSLVVPTLTIATNSSNIAEGGAATITISADQAPVKDTSVNFVVSGTAQPGQDYVPLVGNVLLRAGQTSVTFTFQSIQKDVTFEPTDMIVGQWPIRVGQVFITQGTSIAAGASILSLTEPNVTVTLQASASDFTKLKVGQSCTFTIAGGQQELNGTISELDTNPTLLPGSGAGSAAQQVFEGQIEVSDLSSGQNAADGASVSISDIDKQIDNALTVPIAAVKQNGAGQDVVRLIDFAHGGKISEIPVTTGLTEGAFIQITGGLKAGQTVIVSVNSSQ